MSQAFDGSSTNHNKAGDDESLSESLDFAALLTQIGNATAALRDFRKRHHVEALSNAIDHESRQRVMQHFVDLLVSEMKILGQGSDPECGAISTKENHETAAVEVKGTLPQASTSPFFAVLPAEIRMQIYRELLCTPRVIPGAESVRGGRTVKVISAHDVALDRSLGIDATCLSTCRRMYHEALPIPYRENEFGFAGPESLETFAQWGLSTDNSVSENGRKPMRIFGGVPGPQGRLTYVRNLNIYLTVSKDCHARAHMKGTTPAVHSKQSGRDISIWSDFFQTRRSHGTDHYITFPALKNLTLDFSSWAMSSHESLTFRPLGDRFRTAQGLKSLTIVGLPHEATMDKINSELLGRGGVFRSMATQPTERQFWRSKTQ